MDEIFPNLFKSAASVLPSNSIAPSIAIAGDGTPGNLITATPGTWTGTPAPTYTYQWMLAGSPMGGETGMTLDTTALSASDVITVEETAHNLAGTSSVTSNEITLV
jgi:hypothetical protein